jgi:hypothetical protein
MSMDERVEKLERFFKEVAGLTLHHKVLADTAVVYPSALGEALSRIDPDWVKAEMEADKQKRAQKRKVNHPENARIAFKKAAKAMKDNPKLQVPY